MLPRELWLEIILYLPRPARYMLINHFFAEIVTEFLNPFITLRKKLQAQEALAQSLLQKTPQTDKWLCSCMDLQALRAEDFRAPLFDRLPVHVSIAALNLWTLILELEDFVEQGPVPGTEVIQALSLLRGHTGASFMEGSVEEGTWRGTRIGLQHRLGRLNVFRKDEEGRFRLVWTVELETLFAQGREPVDLGRWLKWLDTRFFAFRLL